MLTMTMPRTGDRPHAGGMRQLALLLAVVVAATALAAPPAPVAATTSARWTLDPCYTIESRLTGAVLQVRAHTFTGAGGQQLTEPDPRLDARLVVGPKTPLQDEAAGAVYRDRVLHQVWVHHDGYLVSKLNGFALDPLGGATDPGTPVVINPLDLGRTPNRVDLDDEGYIVDRETGLVLDIAGSSTAPGAPVVVWPRKGLAWAANQRWNLVRVPDAACYPPVGAAPITHFAGAPSTTQGVPVDRPLHPQASMVAQFAWNPEEFVLFIDTQYRGMDLRGGVMHTYRTVRADQATLWRPLPPPTTKGTIRDKWSAPQLLAEIVRYMPEELYITLYSRDALDTQVQARLYPTVTTASDR
jgi:hypothetical protein